ncbi:unnamed protein product, partial [Discosporangium mesarthrocarpum]
MFVGRDAAYCVLDHPDSGLRSNLTLSCPLERGQVKGEAFEDVEHLFEHAFGILKQAPKSTPAIIPYKPTTEAEDLWQLATMLFEVFKVPAIRFVNEAVLASLAAEMTTGVVVDIGESGIYVTPIFEGYALNDSVRSERVGGQDLTKYLDYMLLSRSNEAYNQL